MSHTETPWVIDAIDATVINAGNKSIAFTVIADEQKAIANAAHIVRCVNAHDDLVKALEAMLNAFHNAPMPVDSADRFPIGQAQAAIAKARA